MGSQITYIATTCTGHFFLGCEIGQLVNLKTGGNVVSGGWGGLVNIIGTDVRVSIWKPTPIIYLAFLKKKQKKPSQFIYLITEKVDLYSYTVL